MGETININRVEKLTGVSKRNIRFYEKEGLLNPARNKENGYRVYDRQDVQRVKVIKLLRMLDMPLDEIRNVLCEEQKLSVAVSNQQAALEQKKKELHAAISFCKQLKETELDTLDVDHCLQEMEQAEPGSFFIKWIDDYKTVLRTNADMDFSFIPETPLTNAREFTDALCAFANKEKRNLVITKESMYPEFLMDDVAYVAERHYTPMRRIPIAVVTCRRKDREIHGSGVAEPRKKLQWFLHRWGGLLGAVVLYLIIALPRLLKDGVTGEESLLFVGFLLLILCMGFRNLFFFFNDKSQ